MLQNLEFTKILPIFAASNRGIRRKDDNLYGLKVVSSPNYTDHHSSALMALFYLCNWGTVMQYCTRPWLER